MINIPGKVDKHIHILVIYLIGLTLKFNSIYGKEGVKELNKIIKWLIRKNNRKYSNEMHLYNRLETYISQSVDIEKLFDGTYELTDDVIDSINKLKTELSQN